MPLVSVLLAAHDDARFLGDALESVLGQTVADLELVVVDDASHDETPDLLAALADRRLVVLRNEEQLGLAASLNRGLDEARGRYVARLDADDVAAPDRLERQLERIRRDSRTAVVGSAVADLGGEGELGRVHRLPAGATAVRWHALFGSPFFHPTVLVDREILDAHGLRYDPSFLESEDYDLWTRLLALAEGDNLPEPLVLKRVHAGQASQRRGELQESFQRQIALREIAAAAPGLDARSVELAWRLGSRKGVPRESRERAGEALLELLAAFERAHGVDPGVRDAAARSLARGRLVKAALQLSPRFPAKVVAQRARRPRSRRFAAPSVRVTVVSPEPTPYRAPLFDRIAARPDIDLTVIYAARTVAGRTWSVNPQHRAVFLRGPRLPARRLLRHDYPVTPGIVRALSRSRPAVAVVSGWSTFASQAAIAWCRARGIPYVLLVESHDVGPRAGWRRAVKDAAVPPIVRNAAGVLVVGTLARESVIARGATPERVRVFANTIDVERWIERAQTLDRSRADDHPVALSVARLVREKGLDVLVRAASRAGIRVVIVGEGPERKRLAALGGELLGPLDEEALAQEYVDADIFALLSTHEPWGVVVNEAAASGLPLVLSDRVGAARDLLRDGENGVLVPADDVEAAAKALRELAADPGRRRRFGERSREIVRGWGYEPSVENFVAAVREARDT